MAFSVIAVSISVSPFFTAELPTAMFMTSAPRRLPASSKEDWVRVEDFEEEVDLGAAAQDRLLLLDLAAHFDRRFGKVEKGDDLARLAVPRCPKGGDAEK